MLACYLQATVTVNPAPPKVDIFGNASGMTGNNYSRSVVAPNCLLAFRFRALRSCAVMLIFTLNKHLLCFVPCRPEGQNVGNVSCAA